jgi:hypothetical protein
VKVLKEVWFVNSTGTVGIIVGEDTVTKERKAYVGVAEGVDQPSDIVQISKHGTKLSLDDVEHVLRLMKGYE